MLMDKGIIAYKSKYGAAKKYALWLAEMTGYDLAETSKAVMTRVREYDNIIFCGGIYASGIAGLKFLRKNYKELKNKKLAVFCVGASPYDEKAFEEIKNHNLKEDLKTVPIFYGRGVWAEDEFTFLDRTMCNILKKAIAKKDPNEYEPWMSALMCAGSQKCDWTDKKYLDPLIQYMTGA